ncbi:hypothetical protein ACIBI3_30085 [Actinomadura luteofluorescens]|uniref:hypothetical protein n=1 Tax=Actinomadura luteofluorescens TaxID=46163 RepID=UPI00347886DE
MQPEQDEHAATQNIAMWGAAGCGKTTFLAALDIALTQVDGDWKVVGADAGSTEVLTDLTRSLADRRQFPRATGEAIERYKWYLIGDRPVRTGRFPRRRTVVRESRIGLDLIDAGGEQFERGRVIGRRLLDNLVQSRGILYLFDPIREYEKGDAFENLHGMLAQLSQRMVADGRFPGGRLPHHLAVCVTKFDEVSVLKTADSIGVLGVDPDDPRGFPRVMEDEDAERLFESLCGVSASGNAELVLRKLKKFFAQDRIRFFVTSAIGFHIPPGTNRFDPRDYQNLVPAPGGYQIRSGVRPINVMEPLLWLAQSLSADQQG